MSFWQNVENELKYKNISRKELADRASFAVSGISLGLSHDSVPSADVAVRIAEVLGVSVEYLVTGREPVDIPKENVTMVHRVMMNLRKLDKYDLESIHLLTKRMAEK